MQETMLKILKNIRNSFFILILLTSNGIAKEITNIQWNKSVAKGKKLEKFRETVTSPALGKKAWKITLLPKDCGRGSGDYSDCKNNGKDAVVGQEVVIEQEVNTLQKKNIPEKSGYP